MNGPWIKWPPFDRSLNCVIFFNEKYSHFKCNIIEIGFLSQGLIMANMSWRTRVIVKQMRSNPFKGPFQYKTVSNCMETAKRATSMEADMFATSIRIWMFWVLMILRNKDHLFMYRVSHFKNKTVVRSSHLYNGDSYTGKMPGKMVSLHWDRQLALSLGVSCHQLNSMDRYLHPI